MEIKQIKKYSGLVFFLCLLISLTSSAQYISQSLNSSLTQHWRFYYEKENKYYPASVPGTIHTDLLANQLIQDPFYSDNEKRLQWIDTLDWVYETHFDIDASIYSLKNIELIFNGLDTYSDVYLNGKMVLSTDNMFLEWSINVENNLKEKDNYLKIVFHSTHKRALLLKEVFEKKHGYSLPEGERVFVRKAQYQFGWDFAPRFLGCGIWRNVYIKGYDILEAQIIVSHPDAKLIQRKDSIGECFYFEKEGTPVFIKGANWVPADVFLPRVTHAKYRSLLCAAKEAGINMLRVWGGGVYEDNYFYQLCDSLNIMVWQDLMFACAMYPDDKKFIKSITTELTQNIDRIGRHRCIALWCGNNECDEGWHNWGWQKQFNYNKKDSIEISKNYNKIFLKIIPKILKECKSKVSYIPSSPQIGWGHKESLTNGDSHYWGVWWGMEPLETYQKKVPRFASEYGMQSLPCLATIKTFAPDSALTIPSAAMQNHQKHPTGFENLERYLVLYKLPPYNFDFDMTLPPPIGSDTASFIEFAAATQQLQSEALETAITAHINGQPRCMGTMFWQFNDCWPGASWSIIDYYGNRKRGYYTVKKLFTKTQQ